MSFVNVTPHALKIRREDGTFLDIPASGTVARVAASAVVVNVIDGVPVRKTTFGSLVDLPESQPGVVYIGSLLVAKAAVREGRSDVVSPGQLLRDEAGQPIGADGLSSPEE